MIPVARHATRRAVGFTFVELLVTLAILSTLSMVALPMAELSIKRSQEFELKRALRDIREALDAYALAVRNGEIASDSDCNYPASIDDLDTGVTNIKTGSKVYFLRRVPSDPFASNPGAPADQQWGQRDYESDPDAPVPGNGPMPNGAGLFDVYSLSTGAGINGVPYAKW